MDNAIALKPSMQDVQNATFAGRIKALPARSKVSFAIGIAALAGVIFAMTMWASQGDYKVLYANLSDKDGGAVIAQLSQMNVPYRMSEGGGAILVPAAQVHDLRLKLATAGLPKGTISGFELMDSARFGQTQFQERLTFQRGLEGELMRSISSLAAVENARVHLALPNQNGFFREQQKPSASVLLTLHAGRTLDRAQIAGIVHLVSSSVPEMSPKAVSILDQTGTLLTGAGDGPQTGLDAQQLQYVAQIEGGYTKRIRELLEPIVGADNLRATVAADIDFSQTEATSEEFKPNQGSDASIAIRSQQTSEQGAGTGTGLPSGVPGAASNQPPIAATAPLVGASQPLQGAPISGAAAGPSGRREAVTNYEVDKTVRVTKNASGNIKHLNAAVVVNNRTVTDAKGKSTQVPLSSDELGKLTALVQESIGFNKERGDSVKVINAPFKIDPISNVEMPFWKSPELIDLVRAAALPAGMAVVAILVFFGLLRPAAKVVFAAPRLSNRGTRIDAVVDDDQTFDAAAALPPPAYLKQIEGAKALAKDNPAAVAGIVRGWVGGQTA
ncbi:MAG: flagellar basal-body MS-ring/collar protein FliF [Caldimonas sp.]|nr:flagellar M-ring protein FliF [Pseudomonadota bacterium]